MKDKGWTFCCQSTCKDRNRLLYETFIYSIPPLHLLFKEEFALLTVLDEPQLAIWLRGCDKEKTIYSKKFNIRIYIRKWDKGINWKKRWCCWQGKRRTRKFEQTGVEGFQRWGHSLDREVLMKGTVQLHYGYCRIQCFWSLTHRETKSCNILSYIALILNIMKVRYLIPFGLFSQIYLFSTGE